MTSTPERFVAHESGAYFHGTKADLSVGDLLVPGRPSNYEAGRIMNHVYDHEDTGWRGVGGRDG